MQPTIKTIPAKKLIGKRLAMTFAENKTFALWSSFMPERRHIANPVNDELVSMQVYPKDFDFEAFDPNAQFDKWAVAEVTDFDSIPDTMEPFELPGGLYAVFVHKGPASDGPKTFGYIFRIWLPTSGFILDTRPHFEILGDKYKNNAPDSEEEIWVPIQPRL